MQSTTAAQPSLADRRPSRRGHVPQISISDTNHHVTEAIGGMYGDDEDDYQVPVRPHRERPLSFMQTPRDKYDPGFIERSRANQVTPIYTHHQNVQDRITVKGDFGSRGAEPVRKTSYGHGDSISPTSPPALSRTSSSDNTAVQQFPLNDIDYESSPAAVAQELSNLQAIRRMSMNVDNADPDLPGFGSIPPPPPHAAGEDDTAKLFWVPARVHPELAPKEFKTFIEDRVGKMRRLSDDGQHLFVMGVESVEGGGSLKRRKSTLSRQVHTESGYEDGATVLERKRSASGQQPDSGTNLAELENLVNDPSSLLHRLSLDTTNRRSQDSTASLEDEEDLPIMPSLASGLRRSTRTAYRRGSLRKGERTQGSKRAFGRSLEGDVDSPTQSPVLGSDEPYMGLSRVMTEPIPQSAVADPTENFSRHVRRPRPQAASDDEGHVTSSRKHASVEPYQETPRTAHTRHSADGRSNEPVAEQASPTIPRIIETPPLNEVQQPTNMFPERKSSKSSSTIPSQTRSSPVSPTSPTSPAAPLISQARSPHQAERKATQSTLDDLSSRPPALPGSGMQRTDDLTVVPTFDTKKPEAKSKKNKWGWLSSSEEREREKEQQREREREREREKEAAKVRGKEDKERAKKPKAATKHAGGDKARLDVLQTSIDSGGPRGRESLVLNREDIKLEQERKKESSRRSRGEEPGKKEKDGLLSALFGGGKKSKAVDDSSKKRNSNRSLSPEPPPKILKPDVDYDWTRFSILEERAIYRMAHIKLANPKRALHSQVLLSNFMYSYLAKVQMMHPQVQVGDGGHHQMQQYQSAQEQHHQQQQQLSHPQQEQERQRWDYSQQQQHQQQQTLQMSQQYHYGLEERHQANSEQQPADEFEQYRIWQAQQAQADGSKMRAAETGSLAKRPGYGNGAYKPPAVQQHSQQDYGSRGAQDRHQQQSYYSSVGVAQSPGADAVGGAGSGAAYGMDHLGYSTNGPTFHDDDDQWEKDNGNMFAGL